MSHLIKEIADKIENAKKQFAENNALLTQKAQQIDQLTGDKTTITALLHQLNGFIAAYEDVKKGLTSESAVEVVETVAEVAKDVVTVAEIVA